MREVHIVFGAESTSPTLPESFRDLPSPEVQASALIIHNANFAPAAVCADLVRQIVYPVGIELEGATVVIATMVDTPAAFPAEKINLQLGPIFDTDLMDWKLPKPAVLSHSALSKECIRALEDLGASTLPEADEIRALLGHAAIRRDPKFERNVLQSLAALSKLRPKQDSLTWQQSICFGWILPYWLIRQPAADEIDEAIDGGKCDSQKSDPRLGRILLDLRNSEQE